MTESKFLANYLDMCPFWKPLMTIRNMFTFTFPLCLSPFPGPISRPPVKDPLIPCYFLSLSCLFFRRNKKFIMNWKKSYHELVLCFVPVPVISTVPDAVSLSSFLPCHDSLLGVGKGSLHSGKKRNLPSFRSDCPVTPLTARLDSCYMMVMIKKGTPSVKALLPIHSLNDLAFCLLLVVDVVVVQNFAVHHDLPGVDWKIGVIETPVEFFFSNWLISWVVVW